MYPTFAMVDGAGEVTDRWAGYPGATEFMGLVDRARDDMRTIAQKKAAFAAEPTLPLALSLGQYSEAVFANAEAVDYYRKAMALDPSLEPKLRGSIFLAMYYGLRSGAFEPSQLIAEGEAILAQPDPDLDAILMVTSVARRVATPERFAPILQQALTMTEGNDDPRVIESRRELLVDKALIIDGDKDAALALKRETLPDGWQDDPSVLNAFAWWCYENDLNLPEAYDLALKGASLAGADGDRANILDTAAEIAFRMGEVDKAIEHETEALRLSPDSKGFQQTLEKFEAAKQG